MKSWQLLPQTPLALDDNPLLATLLAQRGFMDAEQVKGWLDPKHYAPSLPTALLNFSRVYSRFKQALDEKQKILILAHSDLDGITSALLLYESLLRWGIPVEVHLPEYYTITPKSIEIWMSQFQPDLVIICDVNSNTIAPFPVETLILDHHILEDGNRPPFLLNPTLLPANHPLYHLSSVGIVYLLLQQTYSDRGDTRFLSNLQDLLVLGLLADSVPLVKDVRYWVQMGFNRLRKTKRLGLLALFDLLELDINHLTYDNLAFDLIPALNAFGRLADARSAFTLLTTSKRDEIGRLANQALALNEKRKLLTRQITKTIHEQLLNDRTLLGWNVLIFENLNWERAVLGNVANQISQIYQRPVILLAADEHGLARGSARVIGDEIDLLAAFAQCDDLLTRFGGHAQAVALALPKDDIPAFQRRLSNLLPQTPQTEILQIAADIPLPQANLDFAQTLAKMAPFGNGNPRPVFSTHLLKKIRSAKLGRNDDHRRLTLRDEDGLEVSVFWWNSNYFPQPEGQVNLAYEINLAFRDGKYDVQLNLVDWQPSGEAETAQSSEIEWIDCRQNLDLEAIQRQEPDLLIWAEGMSQRESPGLGLSDLNPCEALLIFTAPASPKLLEKAIQKTGAKRIYAHFSSAPYDSAQKLLEAISALLRAAQKQLEGQVKLTQIAERTAHTTETIRLGLEALNDHLQIEWENSVSLKVLAAPSPPSHIDDAPLNHAVSETAAYRRYLQRATLENILT